MFRNLLSFLIRISNILIYMYSMVSNNANFSVGVLVFLNLYSWCCHRSLYPRCFLNHAKNVTNLWKQKTLDKITEILCYASLMYLSSEAETMMKRVLKLGNNQPNNILCAMLWPPSLLFLVLTRMIASSEKLLTSSPGSSRFPIWRRPPPYWKARRPWGRGWQQFNHGVCNGKQERERKKSSFLHHSYR